jgi:hypothetical protein
MARLRSKIAKGRGDAVGDLAGTDLDSASRVPAPPSLSEVAIGGELVPADSDLRDTVTNPDYVTVDASKDRLDLAHNAGVLELALDASDSINAKNSLEKMMAHQMTVLHQATMKLAASLDGTQHISPSALSWQQRNIEQCRLAGTLAKLTTAFQSGLLALHRTRSGGRQHVTVRHTVQHVHVNEGGQAVVAGKISGKKMGGSVEKPGRGRMPK